MRRQSENIDTAEEGLRELADYDDWDEPTASRVVVENHMHMHSEHDGGEDPELSGAANVPAKWRPLVALGTGIGAALLAGLVALLQRCGH